MNACGILAGEPRSICVLIYLDSIPGVIKTFGSLIMLSASSESSSTILSFNDGLRRGLSGINDGVGRVSEAVEDVISPCPVSSDKSVDAEDLFASEGASRVSDESHSDLASDSHFASSNCTPSSDGRTREL